MNNPNTERVVETFIPIMIIGDTTIQVWHRYLDFIRNEIAPIIRRLEELKLISWYSFLIHDKNSGVPTTKDDNRSYVHLRFEIALSAKEHELRAALPESCILTQMINSINILPRK